MNIHNEGKCVLHTQAIDTYNLTFQTQNEILLSFAKLKFEKKILATSVRSCQHLIKF